MLKNKFKFMFLLVAVVMLVSTLSFATDTAEITAEDLAALTTGDNPEVISTASDEDIAMPDNSDWVNGDLYEMNDTVVVDKVVDGNAFIMAKEVTIKSEIGGDAFVMAQKVTIDGGYIYSSLFVMAEEIEINGVVYDVYALANNFTLKENGYIYRDLRVSANTINIDGKIRRDAYMTGMNFNLNKDNGTLIGGKLTYSATSEMTIPENAVVGEVTFNQETVKEEKVQEKAISYIFDALNMLVFTFVVILLAIWLAPKFVEKVTVMDTKKAWTSFGIGFAAIVATPLALILLLLSSICAKVSVVAALVFVAICMSGKAFASIYFGNIFAKLVKWEGKPKYVLSCLITALIIWVIGQIPFIGGLLGFLISVFGIGILFVSVLFKKSSKDQKEEKIEEVKEEKSEE